MKSTPYIGILVLYCVINCATAASNNVMLDWINFQIANVGKLPIPFLGKRRVELVIGVCAYETWALYKPPAKNSIPMADDIKPSRPASDVDISEAVSYAIYNCWRHELSVLNAPNVNLALDSFMISLGYNPTVTTNSTQLPAGVGRLVAETVLPVTDNDGWNSRGDHPAGDGRPYSDYSNYEAINPPQSVSGRTDCSKLRGVSYWQPALEPAPGGGFRIGYWGDMFGMGANLKRFFGIKSQSEHLPPAPPTAGSLSDTMFKSGYAAILSEFAALDDHKKIIAEHYLYYVGVSSVVKGVIERTSLGFDDSVKLYFLVASSLMDTNGAVQFAKRYYNLVRPNTAIQCLYQGQQIKTWLGPYQGVGLKDGSEWESYLRGFVMYPEAEYPSGMAANCATYAEVIKSYFGSDTYNGADIVVAAGGSVAEPKVDSPSDPRYLAGVTDVPNSGSESIGYAPANNITIHFDSWSHFANLCASARVYAGIHIPLSTVEGHKMGRHIGVECWKRAKELFGK